MNGGAPTDASIPRAAPFALYIDKLAASNVGLYYSLLFVPHDHRAALMPLYAFWQEVRAIPDTCTDPQVAGAKLAWWHEEAHEMLAGRARHPVAKALASVVSRHQLTEPSLVAPIEAVARHVARTSPPSYVELRDYGARGRGHIERLAAYIVGCRDPVTMTRVAEIGARLELVALLDNTGADAGRGRCYLPQEDLARFSVDLAALRAGHANEAISELITFEAKRLRAELDEQLARLPVSDHPLLVSLLISGEIARRLLKRIEIDGARILRARPTLMPLRQLWIAWRTARRAGRAQQTT
jgi:phytoene synthase